MKTCRTFCIFSVFAWSSLNQKMRKIRPTGLILTGIRCSGQNRAHANGVVLWKDVCPPSKCLLKSPFLEPLLRTLLRTFPPSKSHCTQRAMRDRLLSRGKKCLDAIFDSQLPSSKLSPKMPPKLSLPHKRGPFSSFKTNPAVRVIARQVRDKNCLAAIVAPRHQSVSQGPLGRRPEDGALFGALSGNPQKALRKHSPEHF